MGLTYEIGEEWTTVCHEGNEITNTLLKAFSNAQLKWDVCGHSLIPLIAMGKAPIKEAYYDLKKRGVRIRWITEITKNNLPYCKELMKFGEVRHLEGIKGSFAISEQEYVSVTVLKEEPPLSQLIYSNIKGIVGQHQYLFETLIDKSIPAMKKIKEIEEGLKPEIIEIISNPVHTLNRYRNILKSSKKDVVLIIPSLNTLYRIREVGIVDLLVEISQKSNVKIRIIMPFETSANRQEIEKIIVDNHNLYIRYAENGLTHTNFTILVIDGEHSLIIEVKDDTKGDFSDAIGFATYSNTKPTVASYSSIFENSWILTELYDHLKESNKELAKAYDEIKIKEELISQVSHELRTPLVPIKGYVEMLLKPKMMGIDLNDKQKKAVLSIQRNVEREISLVEDILDVYTIEMGKLNLNKQNIDVIQLMDQVVKDLQPLIIEKHIEVKSNYKLSSNLTAAAEKKIVKTVNCDPNKIEQVLSNLIKNSIDFVPEKGGKILINIEHNNTIGIFNELIFTVEDNGIGIPKDKRDDVFKKFYQIHTNIERKHGGTGLGLAICQGIIKAHGGRIWVDKDCMVGSKIKFSLPMNNI
jgi:two-component system, OmpR family, sensor histidine kinase VicK